MTACKSTRTTQKQSELAAQVIQYGQLSINDTLLIYPATSMNLQEAKIQWPQTTGTRKTTKQETEIQPITVIRHAKITDEKTAKIEACSESQATTKKETSPDHAGQHIFIIICVVLVAIVLTLRTFDIFRKRPNKL